MPNDIEQRGPSAAGRAGDGRGWAVAGVLALGLGLGVLIGSATQFGVELTLSAAPAFLARFALGVGLAWWGMWRLAQAGLFAMLEGGSAAEAPVEPTASELAEAARGGAPAEAGPAPEGEARGG